MTGPLSAVRIDPVGAARQPARMIRVVLAVACVLAILVPHASFADDPAPSSPEPAPVAPPEPATAPPPAQVQIPPTEQPRPVPQGRREIRIEVPGERSNNNKILVGSLAAAGVIASALGVYWHLDSRDASNEVDADEFTGKAWTEERIGLVDRAERSKTRAIVAYSLGGAILIGAIATWIVTAPKSETAIIRTGGLFVAPTEDGGMVSRMWSF